MNSGHSTTEHSFVRLRIRGLFLSALFFSVFTNILMLTGPLFMLQVYDRVLGSRSEETLVALFGLVTVLYLFYGLLEFARGRVMARAGARFQSAMNGPAFSAVIERGARHIGGSRGGLADVEAIRNFYISPVMLALLDVPWTPLFLLAIFVFHPMLGWLALSGGAMLILIAILNQLMTAQKSSESARLSGVAQRFAGNAEEGAEYVRAQGMGRALFERWQAMQQSATAHTIRVNDWTGSFTSFTKAFRLFLQSAILALGAYLVLGNQLTAGGMIAASIMLGRALAPVETAVAQWQVVQRARSGRRDLRELFTIFSERPRVTELPMPTATLDIKGVTTVTSRGDRPVLLGISLDLRPGEAIGVIGKSGSGKTSLARVIVGLVKPVAGEVRLSGATLDQYGHGKLGRYIGYLPQDLRFFDGTVAENIAQMETHPDSAKVVLAARKAMVHDIILQLPEGYDTSLTAMDAQFSGGQRQRLALARALYNDPIILVLDEPNSALDSDGSEALKVVVVRMKAEGKSVIIMTHRPTAIATCDRLMVLDGGRCIGFGPREEVIGTIIQNAGDVRRVAGLAAVE